MDIEVGVMAARGEYGRRTRELIGTVLEIGAGPGANFEALGPGVDWIGLEPDPRRCAALAVNAQRFGHPTPPLHSSCEAIPLERASVSAVFGTAVLCSVADPGKALAEIARVLQPGGTFVFSEHVSAPPGTMTRRLMQAVTPLTRRFDHGCTPTRDTAETLRQSPLTILEIDEYQVRLILGLAVPWIVGRASLG